MLIITIAYDIEKGTVAWGPLDTEGAPTTNLLHIARALNLVQQEVFSKLEVSTEREAKNEEAA